MAAERISEAAARGYTSEKTRAHQRSQRARGAGLASGRKRRPLRRRRRQTNQSEALALVYRIQQIDREEFARRFGELRERQGIRVSERGLQTRWLEYLSCMGCYRIKGQDFMTSGPRRARALQQRGRERCPRTVTRAHADVAAMGLLRREHVKRCGSRPGRMDCLRIRLLPSFVHLPSAAPTTTAAQSCVGASTAIGRSDSSSDCPADRRGGRGPAPSGSDRPPNGGEMGRRPSPANGNGSDKERNADLVVAADRETAPRASFEEMWAQAGREVREESGR
jgi:hypothetical protein